MTRLDRVLKLLEKYDGLAANHYENHQYLLGYDILLELRKEKQNSPKNLSSTVVGGRTNEKH